MNETIPSVLSYQTSSALFRTNEYACFPAEGNQSVNGRYTVRLPQKSIINLSSIRATFTNTVSGLVDTGAANYRNALANCPVHTLFRSIQFRVGGTTVCGQSSQHYNQIYHALVKASVSETAAKSKCDNGYGALIIPSDDANEAAANAALKGQTGCGTSKSARLVMSDILGMRSGTESWIDTSLYGDVEIIFELAGAESMIVHSATAAVAGAVFTLSDFQVNIKAISSISPLYVEMLASRLQSNQPLRWPFQNYSSTLANNATGCTLSVNTGCLDLIMFVPFNADPNTLANVPADSVNSNKFRFGVGSGGTALTKANANTFTYQAKINNQYYPVKVIQNALDCASITSEAIFGSADMAADNMLFLDYLDASGTTFNKTAFLTENFILIQKVCGLQEGWAGVKQASGISSNGSQMDINLSYANAGSYQLVAAFYTSYLVYDPQSGGVSIEN